MVKCTNCGVEVDDDIKFCPNCGNYIVKNDITDECEDNLSTCTKCGAELKEDNSFCPVCGNKVESNEHNHLKCENCGSTLSENTLFCTTCGAKVKTPAKQTKKHCPECGSEVDTDTAFCQECGANIFMGKKIKKQAVSSSSFIDKINFNIIIKPAILSLVLSLIISFIGLLIGFSWFSFVIAIILSVGFFAAAIDNDANSIVFGLIVGLVLGILETPLVEFTYGAFVAGFYEGFFGGHLVLLMILGAITAFISNLYFKNSILSITDNFKGLL